MNASFNKGIVDIEASSAADMVKAEAVAKFMIEQMGYNDIAGDENHITLGHGGTIKDAKSDYQQAKAEALAVKVEVNPSASVIEQAVAPLKSEAIDRAEKEAHGMIKRAKEQLEAHGWNLTALAPRPNSTKMSRAQFQQMSGKRSFFQSLTVTVSDWSRRHDEPVICEFSAERAALFVERAKEQAAFEYDAFVAKLIKKVGEAKAANLIGNHVWGFSHLVITKADGSEVIWKTQMIINVSKLGKYFNQFPTRQVKKIS